MTHKSFKLNGRQTIGGFTPWQWLALIPGIGLAYAFARCAPLPLLMRLFLAVVGAGCHVFGVYLSGFLELNLIRLAREAIRWWRADERYSPGADAPDDALVVIADERAPQPPWVFEPLDLEALSMLAPGGRSGRNGDAVGIGASMADWEV
jgi:hypothetical protein